MQPAPALPHVEIFHSSPNGQMTVQLFDIWFYIKHNSKQQYKTHQSLSPRKWEGQDGGWAQSAPNTGCAREQASVLLRKSLFGGNPSEGFTDIRRWSHFTDCWDQSSLSQVLPLRSRTPLPRACSDRPALTEHSACAVSAPTGRH